MTTEHKFVPQVQYPGSPFWYPVFKGDAWFTSQANAERRLKDHLALRDPRDQPSAIRIIHTRVFTSIIPIYGKTN